MVAALRKLYLNRSRREITWNPSQVIFQKWSLDRIVLENDLGSKSKNKNQKGCLHRENKQSLPINSRQTDKLIPTVTTIFFFSLKSSVTFCFPSTYYVQTFRYTLPYIWWWAERYTPNKTNKIMIFLRRLKRKIYANFAWTDNMKMSPVCYNVIGRTKKNILKY